jgi:hypothetical protein
VPDWLMIVAPQGDPEKVGAAVAKLRAGAREFAALADDFGAAARSAGTSWAGPAAAAFSSASGPVGGYVNDTAAGHGQLAVILGTYRDALEAGQSAATRAHRQISEALDGYSGRGRALASDIADQLEGSLPSADIGPLATTMTIRLRSWDLPPGFAPYFEAGAVSQAYFPPESIVADLSGPAGVGLSAQLLEMPLFVVDLAGEHRNTIAALEEELACSVSAAQSSLRTALSDLRDVAGRSGSDLLEVGEHFFAPVPDPRVLRRPGGDGRSFGFVAERPITS